MPDAMSLILMSPTFFKYDRRGTPEDIENVAARAVAVIDRRRRPQRCFAQAVVAEAYPFDHETQIPLLIPSSALSITVAQWQCVAVPVADRSFVLKLERALVECAAGMRRTVVLRGATGSGKTQRSRGRAAHGRHVPVHLSLSREARSNRPRAHTAGGGGRRPQERRGDAETGSRLGGISGAPHIPGGADLHTRAAVDVRPRSPSSACVPHSLRVHLRLRLRSGKP